MVWLGIGLVTFILSSPFPQDQAPSSAKKIETREQEIETARDVKAGALEPEVAPKWERRLVWVQDNKVLDKITYGLGGLRLRMGGMVTGSGFALGPEYFRDDLAKGNVVFRATALGSTRLYQRFDVELRMPRLAQDRAFVDVLGSFQNSPQMNYYGPGPDSEETGRSNYRLEQTVFDVTAGLKPLPRLRLGASGGFLGVNVGPGTDGRLASAERIYGPALAPGIDNQSDFLRTGAFAQYDYRDIPGGPRSGGNYLARFTYNFDRDLGRHSFRRIDLEAQQYLPFFNARRVIALRAKTALTDAEAGHVVPFYLQPTLGGSDDLRGFRPFRFYGNNVLVLNAEYRYEIFSGMDMAIFGDAGKVFQDSSELNFRDLEGAYGFGMRFNARNSVFMRIDVGFSHEGFQVWVKFNNVF